MFYEFSWRWSDCYLDLNVELEVRANGRKERRWRGFEGGDTRWPPQN
jgi:hypothetical protein